MKTLSSRAQEKLDTLKYRSDVSSVSQNKMKSMRAKFYALAEQVLSLGESRETSEAFTNIETALQFTIKHLCLIDPGAVVQPIEYSDDSDECEGSSCCSDSGCTESAPI